MAISFPFAAIVGQEALKQSLLLVTIDPTIGGVLILGDRGTGKSTAVRALADLLPKMDRLRDCRYGCAPQGPSCVGQPRHGQTRTGAIHEALMLLFEAPSRDPPRGPPSGSPGHPYGVCDP